MSKAMKAERQDGIQYRRAKLWQIALSQLAGAGQMCFYVLLGYATYIGNANFGILVAVTGVIITVSRIFDGITDPICAYIIERFNPRHGKIRIFLIMGWGVMSLATSLMCNIGAGKMKGLGGLVFFIACYMIYIIGYTLVGIATSMMGNIMTNDPHQRPTLGVFNTIYSYVAPMIMSIVGMVVLLPRFSNQIGTEFLAALNLVVMGASLVFYILACIGITPYDKAENYEIGVSKDGKEEKPGIRDMISLIRDNKELRRYMLAAVSDKLAQSIGGVSVVSTLYYGIMIGNYNISTTISTIAMAPGIVFAIIGARLCGKYGNKKVMVDWTWVSLFLNILYAAFLLFTDTTQITKAIVPSIIFFFFIFSTRAVNMVVSAATNTLRMDIVDYELYRSGKFMPATVAATYGFVDKLVSSLGPTIATLMIGLIGYTTTAPQLGDPLTMNVKAITVILMIGFPIIGWICTIWAMKGSKLTREKMIEVQKAIHGKTSTQYKNADTDGDMAYQEMLHEAVEENFTPGK